MLYNKIYNIHTFRTVSRFTLSEVIGELRGNCKSIKIHEFIEVIKVTFKAA